MLTFFIPFAYRQRKTYEKVPYVVESTPDEAAPSLRALFRPAAPADGAERLYTLVRLTAEVLLEHRQDIRELGRLATGSWPS